MNEEPFSYINETLAEDRKLTAIERGETMSDNPVKWNPYNKVVQDHR